jgi:hypothetical protein
MNQLNWTDEDDHARVLSVWRDGQPIATMRVEMVPDRGYIATYSSGLMPPAHHLEWPAFALARVATHAAYGRTGLNSLMRRYFLESAICCGVRRQYGYVVVGAARTQLMAKLGYEFLLRADQDPDLASQRPWALTWIDLREHGSQALAQLDLLISQLSQEYPWVGPPLVLEHK